MNANYPGTAKRGEKRHRQKLVPWEKGKLNGDRLRLNRQSRRVNNWKASPSSFSWVSFLGCLHAQQCSVLFLKTTYSRETWHCGVQREERIVHAFAWFRNWSHQSNAPCLQLISQAHNPKDTLMIAWVFLLYVIQKKRTVTIICFPLQTTASHTSHAI